MSSHLYSRLNGQERIFPCQVSRCPRARNNSVERRNVRWFCSKELMVKHMNRKHNICINTERKRLHNIGLSQGAIRPICSGFDSQEGLRRFPCLFQGCVRARNESRNKTNIKWFTSKLERTRHLNRKHGAAIRTNQKFSPKRSQNDVETKIDKHEAQSNFVVLKKTDTCSTISSNHEISSRYRPPHSVKCEPLHTTVIEFSNDSLSNATEKAKNAPYLPPLSPNGPSSRIAFDHKMRNRRPPRVKANLKESEIATDRNQKPMQKKMVEGENNWIGKSSSEPAVMKKTINGNDHDALCPGKTNNENNALEFTYLCAFCNWKGTEIGSLNYHIWERHFEWFRGHKMIHCLHCPQRLEKLSELAWHTRMWHNLEHDYLENGYVVCCIRCNELFLDYDLFDNHQKSGDCSKQYREKLINTTNDSGTESGKNNLGENCTGRNENHFMHFAHSDDECKDENVAKRINSKNNKNRNARFFATKNCPSSHESVAKAQSCKKQNQKSKQQKPFWEKYC